MTINIRNRYNILQIVVLLIIFIFYELVGRMFTSFFPYIGEYITVIIHILWVFLMYSTYLFYILILMKKNGLNIKSELTISIKKKDFLLGMLAFLIALIPLLIISFYLPIVDSSNLIPIINILLSGSYYITLIIFICLMGIYGPIIEEILFRGFIWKVFEEMKINRVIVLFIISLLFASYHLEVRRFPVLFILGLTLGLLKMHTRRLGASMIAHMMINILALISILGS